MILIVKGTPEQAVKAAESRGIIPARPNKESDKYSMIHVPDEWSTKIIRWFAERPPMTEGYGFPPGTLLFFHSGKERAE